ncbi:MULTISPECIES: MFS transporter [Proteiniphilum]|jgi:MFS family permease|uniref:MFS transporter n=1 Tax=Proteiniphilum TaxID=294702 RepID=UPI001EEC70C8|nr:MULTISPECIES: MFS transporter [Proteiniphilum]ULB33917.1 MFS transporter [Proteiniphilum propionicum]
MKLKRYFGLEKNVFYTGLTSFFTDTSSKMVYSVMPLFLMSIGASKIQISLIEGIAESTASLLKAVSGFWSDKIGKNKPFMFIGYTITALITPLYAYVVNPMQVLAYRFLERVGKGIRTAPRDSLISGSVNNGETGKSFGFHKAMDNSGAIVGPLMASGILFFLPKDNPVLQYKIIFWVATVPAVIGVLTIIFFLKEAKSQKSFTVSKISLKQLPRNYSFFLIIVAVFTLGNSTDSLLIVRTSETGISPSLVPLIYMLFNTVSVLLAIPFGKLSDKIGRAKLITAGFIVYSFVYFMFGASSQILVYIAMFGMYGVYSALTDTCQKALVSDLIPNEMKGTGYGLYHAVLGIMLLPASVIAGYLYDRVSPGAPFYFGSVMSLIAAALMIMFLFVNKKA